MGSILAEKNYAPAKSAYAETARSPIESQRLKHSSNWVRIVHGGVAAYFAHLLDVVLEPVLCIEETIVVRDVA